MLKKLLAEIQAGGTLSPAVLAAKLNVSVGLVQAMLADLERRGLLAPVNTDCTDTCKGCSISDACGHNNQAQGKLWMLASRPIAHASDQ